MRKLLKELLECDQKVIVTCFVAAFSISLIPVLYLSGYGLATEDDYGYGARIHAAWLKSCSLCQTLKVAAAMAAGNQIYQFSDGVFVRDSVYVFNEVGNLLA